MALAAAVPARADFDSSGIGTAGSEFLAVDQGPRGIAMGGALTSLTNDAVSMYWNPAGLALVPRLSISGVYTDYFADIKMGYVAYAQRLKDTSVLGFAVRHLDGGRIAKTDVNGLTDPGDASFRPRSTVYEVGLGRFITDLADFEREIAFGVTGRVIDTDFGTGGTSKATGFGADIGVQTHHLSGRYPYHFGLAAQNLGRGQKFDRERDTLPFRAKVGTAVHLHPSFLLSVDGVFPITNRPYASLGVEAAAEPQRGLKGALRAGLDSQALTGGLSGFRGVSFGVGFSAVNMSVDYAFVPYGIFSNTHRVSLSFNLPAKISRRYRDR